MRVEGPLEIPPPPFPFPGRTLSHSSSPHPKSSAELVQWIFNRQRALGMDEDSSPLVVIITSMHLLDEAKEQLSKVEGAGQLIYLPKPITDQKVKTLIKLGRDKLFARAGIKTAGIEAAGMEAAGRSAMDASAEALENVLLM